CAPPPATQRFRIAFGYAAPTLWRSPWGICHPPALLSTRTNLELRNDQRCVVCRDPASGLRPPEHRILAWSRSIAFGADEDLQVRQVRTFARGPMSPPLRQAAKQAQVHVLRGGDR